MHADRGMIPRSISHMYKAQTQRSEHTFAVHVSYMEIYNGVAYDLLDPSRDIKELADLPQVWRRLSPPLLVVREQACVVRLAGTFICVFLAQPHLQHEGGGSHLHGHLAHPCRSTVFLQQRGQMRNTQQ